MAEVYLNDELIIEEILAGNSEAFAALYKKYAKEYFLICKRYARVNKDADDYLQDSLVQIYTQITKYDAKKGNFLGWSKRVVINTCLMKLRKFSFSDTIDEMVEMASSFAIQPVAYDNIGLKELTALIQKLPKGYRTVFNMFVIDGFTHQEISDQMGISVGTSKSQLLRAKKALQNSIHNVNLKIVNSYG